MSKAQKYEPAHMEVGQAGIDLAKSFEGGPDGGFAPTAYRCPAGHLTVGWGHRVQDGERYPAAISAAEAEALLRADLAAAAAVHRYVRVPLTQSMFDALVCFAFNVGAGALIGSTLLRLLNAGDYAGAADQFPRWDKATNPRTGKKEPLAGLTRRRAAERALFLEEGMPG